MFFLILLQVTFGAAVGLHTDAHCLSGTIEILNGTLSSTNIQVVSACINSSSDGHILLSCKDSQVVILDIIVGVNPVAGHCFRSHITTCAQHLPVNSATVIAKNSSIEVVPPTEPVCNSTADFIQVTYRCGADLSIFKDDLLFTKKVSISLATTDNDLPLAERKCSVKYRQGILSKISAKVQLQVHGTTIGTSMLILQQQRGNDVWEQQVDLSSANKTVWDIENIRTSSLYILYKGFGEPATLSITSEHTFEVTCTTLKRVFDQDNFRPTLPSSSSTSVRNVLTTPSSTNITGNVSKTAAPNNKPTTSTTPTLTTSKPAPMADGMVSLCPANWIVHGDKCYKHDSNDVSCRLASHECMRLGGSLVVIESQEEWNFILRWLSEEETTTTRRYRYNPISHDSYLIGLFDFDSSAGKDWIWSNGVALNETKGNFTKSFSGDGGPCATLTGSEIEAVPAWKSYKYICQLDAQEYRPELKNKTSSLPTYHFHDIDDTESSTVCDAGWQERPDTDYCYYFSTDDQRGNYSEARVECIERGGWLVNVDSKDEIEWLQVQVMLRNMRDSKENQWWTGLTYDVESSVWHWANCDVLQEGDISWRQNEPNNPSVESCAELTWEGNWNDHSCSQQFEFICVKAKDYTKAKLIQNCAGPNPGLIPDLPNQHRLDCKYNSGTSMTTQPVTTTSETTTTQTHSTTTTTKLPTKPSTSHTSRQTSITTSVTTSPTDPSIAGKGDTKPSGSSSAQSHKNPGVVAGVVIGSVLMLVVVALFVAYVVRRGGSPCIRRSSRRVPYSTLHDELVI